MSAWVGIEWFDNVFGSGATETIDAGSLGSNSNPWSAVPGGEMAGSSTDPLGGSGDIPKIALAVDLWLRDEGGYVITDGDGDGISLEVL